MPVTYRRGLSGSRQGKARKIWSGFVKFTAKHWVFASVSFILLIFAFWVVFATTTEVRYAFKGNVTLALKPIDSPAPGFDWCDLWSGFLGCDGSGGDPHLPTPVNPFPADPNIGVIDSGDGTAKGFLCISGDKQACEELCALPNQTQENKDLFCGKADELKKAEACVLGGDKDQCDQLCNDPSTSAEDRKQFCDAFNNSAPLTPSESCQQGQVDECTNVCQNPSGFGATESKKACDKLYEVTKCGYDQGNLVCDGQCRDIPRGGRECWNYQTGWEFSEVVDSPGGNKACVDSGLGSTYCDKMAQDCKNGDRVACGYLACIENGMDLDTCDQMLNNSNPGKDDGRAPVSVGDPAYDGFMQACMKFGATRAVCQAQWDAGSVDLASKIDFCNRPENQQTASCSLSPTDPGYGVPENRPREVCTNTTKCQGGYVWEFSDCPNGQSTGRQTNTTCETYSVEGDEYYRTTGEGGSTETGTGSSDQDKSCSGFLGTIGCFAKDVGKAVVDGVKAVGGAIADTGKQVVEWVSPFDSTERDAQDYLTQCENNPFSGSCQLVCQVKPGSEWCGRAVGIYAVKATESFCNDRGYWNTVAPVAVSSFCGDDYSMQTSQNISNNPFSNSANLNTGSSAPLVPVQGEIVSPRTGTSIPSQNSGSTNSTQFTPTVVSPGGQIIYLPTDRR